MATDQLRIEANERIDVQDFEYLANEGFGLSERDPFTGFHTDPSKSQAWILEGFTMSNPVGKQVEVARGRGILSQRIGGQTYKGALSVGGDATKTVDITGLGAGTYSIYIRFEFVDGDSASRVFWNPAGLGTEFAQTVATRKQANWSLRVESSNPGSEWLKIGEVDQATMAFTDLRPLYFEGVPDTSYPSGWSTDGGGSANDRNADRQQYGVFDTQTFTAAMRQCLEDIKGRGLRRWWDRDIGGMNIGFDADPIEDILAVGNANFKMDYNAGNPRVTFDTNDNITYNRTTDTYQHFIAGVEEMRLSAPGIQIANGLNVGIAIGSNTPSNDVIKIGDTAFNINYNGGTIPEMEWDQNDRVAYNRASDYWEWLVASAATARLNAAGLQLTNGLNVGIAIGTAPTTDRINVGDVANHWSLESGVVYQRADTNDYLAYVRSLNIYSYNISGVEEMRLGSSGLEILNGLNVGIAIGSAPVDDQIQIGDANFQIGNAGTAPGIQFDANDYFSYTRASNQLAFLIAASEEIRVTGSGLAVQNGVYIGGVAGAPYDNDLTVEGGIDVGFTGVDPIADAVRVGDSGLALDFSGGAAPFLSYDANDYVSFTRATNVYTWNIGGVAEMQLFDSGLQVVNGLVVGTTGTTNYDNDLQVVGGAAIGFLGNPGDDEVQVGDANFGLNFSAGVNPYIGYDGNDFSDYNRTSNHWRWIIAGSEEARITASGLAIQNGLYVGAATGAPLDNDIVVEGGINCGGAIDPQPGEGIFTDGIAVGFDASPGADQVLVGDTLFNLDYDGAAGPRINFDTDDYFRFVRLNNQFDWVVGGVVEMRAGSDGLRITNGLYVGSTGTAPNDNDIMVEGGINCGGTTNPAAGEGIFTDGLIVGFDGNPGADTVAIGDGAFYAQYVSATQTLLNFDAGDYINYNRSSNLMQFFIGSAEELRITASGINVTNGIYVGNATTAPTDNDIRAEGDVYAAAGYFRRDDNDYLLHDGSNFRFFTNATEEMRLSTDGLRVTNGLYVGSATGTPTDNDIVAEGTIQANVGFIPDANEGAYIGTSGSHFSDIHANKGRFYQDDKAPDSQSDVCSRHGQNAIIMRGSWSGASAADMPVTADHWNTGNLIRTFGGITWNYILQMDQASADDTGTLVVGREFPQNPVRARWWDADQIQLNWTNMSGTEATPTETSQKSHCVAVGRPGTFT